MSNLSINVTTKWELIDSSQNHRAELFSTLGVISRHSIIKGTENSITYTAFATKYGKYELLHVPFGIHVASSYFAMVISGTLKGLDFCFAYLDDMRMYSLSEKGTPWPPVQGKHQVKVDKMWLSNPKFSTSDTSHKKTFYPYQKNQVP